jgi:hypothetical protein
VSAIRRLGLRHPEWPWALAAAGGWIALVFGGHHHEPGHAHMAMPMPPDPHPHVPAVAWWSLMVLAAMVPPALPVARAIGLGGMWRRRIRGPAIFMTTYVAAWTLLGAAALAAWTAVGKVELTPAALLVAAAWELTLSKRRSLKRCHRIPALAPRGRAADAACLRFGAFHAGACMSSCGPMMLAMVPLHSLALMVALAALSAWERFARRPRLRVCAIGLAGLGVLVAA